MTAPTDTDNEGKTPMVIARTAVVGSGLMGAGIAEVLAKSGCDVIVSEVDTAAVDAGRARIEKSLAKAVEPGPRRSARETSPRGPRGGPGPAALHHGHRRPRRPPARHRSGE